MPALFVTVPVDEVMKVPSPFFKDLFELNPGVKVGWEGVDDDTGVRTMTISVHGARELVGLPAYAQVSTAPPVSH